MDTLATISRVRVAEEVITHVKRVVPANGSNIHVKVGDEVKPGDILGDGQNTTGFRVINLAKELRVSPKQVPALIKRQIGQIIYEGELLATHPGTLGLGKKNFLAPIDGLLDFYDSQSGDLRLKHLPKNSKIASGVFGVVDKVDMASGEITIRTQASLIYGEFGSGKEREGILTLLGGAGELISSKQISANFAGRIIVGGGLIFMDALEKARSVGISGIITGGINAGDFKTLSGGEWFPIKKHWNDIGFTLVVTEGYGAIPIGEDIFTVLKKFNGRYAIVDGNRARLILPSASEDCIISIRKTKLSVSPDEVEPTSIVKSTTLAIGMKVRVVSPSFLGVQGVVESIDRLATLLPSGLKAILVTVVTGRQKMRVPLQNLEII